MHPKPGWPGLSGLLDTCFFVKSIPEWNSRGFHGLFSWCVTAVLSWLLLYDDYPFPLEPPFLHPFRPSRSSQGTELSFRCFTAGSHELSVLHIDTFICQCSSPSSSHHPLPNLCPRLGLYLACFLKDHSDFYMGSKSIEDLGQQE